MDPGACISESAPAAAAVLDYLRRPGYRPLAQRQLLHRMQVSSDRRPMVRRLIRELLRQGKIVELSRGRLAAAPSGGTVVGVLHRHRDGYGFVSPDDGGEDVYVAPQNLEAALSGDRVGVRLTRRGRSRRREGVVVQMLERRSRQFLGLFVSQGRGGVVEPLDPSLSERILIPASFRIGARDQQVVRAEILRPPGGGAPAEGKILEVLGHLDEAGTDVHVLVRKYGLEVNFVEDALEEARKLPTRVGSKEARRRRRFDDPPPVTIDGETAKDFDDAIAVEELRDGAFRLFVHIADVAHFVAVGSALDREARRRGTSVYFPDRVLPMLPEKLSNELCSLRPGVDRLVQSAILEIDARGRTRKARFVDGVIRSAARLTYTQVADVIGGNRRVRGVPQKLVPMLLAANRLRERLEKRRHARGSVDFDLPEPQILLDVEGLMSGITIEPRNEAHRLIEECMLAANEAVASELERRGRACMFRVHEAPDPMKLAALENFIESYGERVPARPSPAGPEYIRRLLEPFEGREEYPLISQVALRSMKRARYSMTNSGHFGLAAPSYCHFTSPIRRYPDLVVHRLLRSSRSGRARAEAWEANLEGVAENCSELERNAEAAERELLLWKKVAFISGKVGERFRGLVTGVASFGLFVQLGENMVEGLLRVDRLGDERFEFLESRFELRGVRSGRVFRLGDRLEVRVERVDRVLLRVDFSLVGTAERGVEEAARRRRNRRR